MLILLVLAHLAQRGHAVAGAQMALFYRMAEALAQLAGFVHILFS
ncbi:hypothetical protein [Chromobacterium violaceum]|nr:hypothetical protein [Chromobacterium violaceum]